MDSSYLLLAKFELGGIVLGKVNVSTIRFKKLQIWLIGIDSECDLAGKM